MADSSQDAAVYRVKEAFAVAGEDGFPRTYAKEKLIAGSDPLAASHRHLLEPVANAVEKTTVILDVEQATAEPGRRRRGLRLPSGVDVRQATEPHPIEENTMPHALPPENPLSPASPFAPAQPGLGVVADDVPEEQNPGGGPSAAEVTAEAAKDAADQAADDAAEAKKAAVKASKSSK